MSSSAAEVSKQKPLGDFTKISNIIYLYRPDDKAATASSTKRDPKLILFGAWMGAANQHIAKYTVRLQAIYPSSPILVVKSLPHHFTRVHSLEREILPAIPVIRSILGTGAGDPTHPELLIHLFSNGGSSMKFYLYKAFASTAKPGESKELPANVTVYDSCPGKFTYGRTMTAFTIGLSTLWKIIMAPFFHSLVITYWLTYIAMRRPDPLKQFSLGHNNKALNSNEVRRAYIYSEADKLVGSDAVEEHIAEAKANGFNVVRVENFKGTPHVAHMRSDEERYWGVVRELWDGEK